MPEFDLFNHPTADPRTCIVCGRIFEGPITTEAGVFPGHQAGNPRVCHPEHGIITSDGRIRRKARARKLWVCR